MSNDGHARVLFEVLMKEKLLEASLRRSVSQLGKERDNAFAAMKKSQLEHTLAVAKHENMQSELRQKIVTVGLIREAWDSERVVGVDVVPAGIAGGYAGINGDVIDDVAAGANGAGEGAVASSYDNHVVEASGAAEDIGTGADVGPDFDHDSEEFEALLLENVLKTEGKLTSMKACDKVSVAVSDVNVDSSLGVNIAKSIDVGAGYGGNGDSGSKVKGTVIGDSPVGVNIADTDLGLGSGGSSDTARKLKDICLSIPMLESPNEKQNDTTAEKSKRKGSNAITHEYKSTNKGLANPKSTKASANSKRVKRN